TNWLMDENFTPPPAAGGFCTGGCCANSRLKDTSRTTILPWLRMFSEPHSQIGLQGPHLVGRRGQPELRIAHGGIPSLISDMVEREAAAGDDRGGERPILDERASPSVEQSSAPLPHARAVLPRNIQQVALVEIRKPPLRGQIQPVLRHQRTAAASSAERRVVD